MNKIYLVACVSQKTTIAKPAKDLYISDWFKKAKAYVETVGDQWYILSAAHGLISPSQIIRPYNVTLNNMKKSERDLWSIHVMVQIEQKLNKDNNKLYFLAGIHYRESLINMLTQKGWITSTPMKGLGIGQQLKWLKEQLIEKKELSQNRIFF